MPSSMLCLLLTPQCPRLTRMIFSSRRYTCLKEITCSGPHLVSTKLPKICYTIGVRTPNETNPDEPIPTMRVRNHENEQCGILCQGNEHLQTCAPAFRSPSTGGTTAAAPTIPCPHNNVVAKWRPSTHNHHELVSNLGTKFSGVRGVTSPWAGTPGNIKRLTGGRWTNQKATTNPPRVK